MKRSKFSEQQIAFILRQAEEGTSVEEVYAPTIAAGVRFPVLWLIGGWGGIRTHDELPPILP